MDPNAQESPRVMSEGTGMTEDELRAIETRVLAASRGPWKSWIEGRDHTSGSSFIATSESGAAASSAIELTGATDADQDFIAHARQDVPRLVEEVRRLRSELDVRRKG